MSEYLLLIEFFCAYLDVALIKHKYLNTNITLFLFKFTTIYV